jgi:hypothetical protein
MTNYYQNHSKFQTFDLLKGSEILILKFWKVTVVFVDICPWRTLLEVRYAENGKFLKSFGTESKEFWQKKISINFGLDIIDLKKSKTARFLILFCLFGLK